MIDEKKLIEDLKEYKIDNISINGKSIIDIINEQPKTDWIPCEVEMPKEHESMFAKFKGTDKWDSGMFEKLSDEVNVTVEFSDGTRKVITTHTADGKWHVEKFSHLKTKVIAWMPMLQPYKKEGAE